MLRSILTFLGGLMFFQTASANTFDVHEVYNIISSGNSNYVIIDVREPDELVSSLGHINGVINIPLGNILTSTDILKPYEQKEIVFVCRSGNRSGRATATAERAGYKAHNMSGGMLSWNEANLPVEH